VERVARRGDVWWATLGRPRGSEPGYRRPVVVIQSDDFNRSAIATVIVAAVTTNIALARAPGNVLFRPSASGLRRPSVVNVSQIATVDRHQLLERAGHLPEDLMRRVDEGVRLVLAV
jgi:mRNA interferase MazF